MTGTIALLATTLALLLAAGPLQSQPAGDGQSGAAQAQDEEQAKPGDPENAGGEESEGQASSSPGDDSPFDYEASEKISEDLSVSFPVDI